MADLRVGAVVRVTLRCVTYVAEIIGDHGNGLVRVRVTDPGNSWHEVGRVLDIGVGALSNIG